MGMMRNGLFGACRSSLFPAPDPAGADVHDHGCADAGAGDRGHHRDLLADLHGHAEVPPNRWRIALAVVRGAFAQTLLGLVLGFPVAWTIGRLLKSRLFGVGAADPLSLLLPAAALLLCAGVASLVPAIRAASVEPLEALRTE
jgi:hypothetical protein